MLPTVAFLPLVIPSGDLSIVLEGGVLELQQAGLLIVAVCGSLIVASRLEDRQCRNGTLMLGVLAAMALAREQDLHVLVNPEHLGPWGVRFRVDWWLSGEVGIGVKAAWLGVFGLVALVLGLLAHRSRGPIDWRRARPRLMVLAVAMYGAGFACDDLLRGRIDLGLAQTFEECAELIAAAAFLGAVLGPESAVRFPSVRIAESAP